MHRAVPGSLAIAGAVLLLSACSATPAYETIEEVWQEIECSENDPDGSFGMIFDGDDHREASCRPFYGRGMVYFYEFPGDDAVAAWNDSGIQPEPRDAIYAAGNVVMVTGDSAAVTLLADRFDPLP